VRTLLRGGSIRAGDRTVSAMATEDDRVVWLGDDAGAAAYDGADEVMDLHGRLVTPAFVDAHVHLVQTGRQLDGLDLIGTRSRHEVLGRVAAHVAALPPGEVVIGAGWDETDWADRGLPTADELERVAAGRRLYLSRVDGHSAIVSHALMAETPDLAAHEGWSASGRLERQAKHRVSDRLADLVGPQQRLAAARRAVSSMAATGIAAFHENAAPHIGPEYELALVSEAAADAGLRATTYWGELGAFDKVERLGVAGLAGDLVADGAVGSRTAALRDEYADLGGHCGHGYLDADQIADHVVGCTERGIQAGFHCIGDAALDVVGDGFAAAAARVGDAAVRAGGHRLEHCEMPSAATVALLARLGVTASVQPMFDGLWGGPAGMYAERLGRRWAEMNPFADLHAAGVRLALGSDSPVTAPDPWRAVQAAVHHRTDGQGLTADQAFHAHTVGGWAAARQPGQGVLAERAPATYAVWTSQGFPDLTPGADLPTCARTVVDGRVVHRSEEN
jgi:predicted amidohydrolase YtcJ